MGFGYSQLPVLGDSAATSANRILSSFNDVKNFLIAPNSITSDLVDVSVLNAAVPIGTVFPFAGASVPGYWLLCDGSAVNRVTYTALFAIISTNYGAGDGTTTFNLPDLRGRMPVGKGTHADVSALGANDGITVASRTPKIAHTHSVAAHTHTVPAHTHSIPAHKHAILSANMTVTVAANAVNRIIDTGAGAAKMASAGSYGPYTSEGSHTHTATASGTAGATGATDGDAAMVSGSQALTSDSTALTSDSTTVTAPFVALNFMIKSGVS